MKIISGLLLALTAAMANAQMDSLSNDELDGVTGQTGVAIGIDWRLNVDGAGTKLSLCTAAATYKECRIGWAFNNRGTDDVDKRWLVLKGFTGGLVIPYLTVDASSVTYTNKSAVPKTIPAILLSLGDPTNNYSGANTKMKIKNLTIENMAMEQDTAARRGYFADSATEPTGTAIPANVNTGFAGLQINGPSNVANVQVDGTIKLFSCLGDHPSC